MSKSFHSQSAPLLDCLSELHRWQPPGNFRSAMCNALLKVVPAAHFSYSVIDTVRWTTRAAGTTKVLPSDELRRYLAQLSAYVRKHPCINHMLAHPGVSLTSISDVTTARGYRGGSLYNEVYAPQGVEDQLTLNLADSTPGKWHCLAASRHRRGFSSVDRERLAVLRPHLIAAVIRARSLARLRAIEQRALHQLDVLAPAAVTLAPGGVARGVFFNPRARAVLAAWFAFEPLQTGDALPGVLAAWLREQRRDPRGRRVAGKAAPAVRAGGTRGTAAGRQPARRDGWTRRPARARRAPGRAAIHRAAARGAGVVGAAGRGAPLDSAGQGECRHRADSGDQLADREDARCAICSRRWDARRAPRPRASRWKCRAGPDTD